MWYITDSEYVSRRFTMGGEGGGLMSIYSTRVQRVYVVSTG